MPTMFNENREIIEKNRLTEKTPMRYVPGLSG